MESDKNKPEGALNTGMGANGTASLSTYDPANPNPPVHPFLTPLNKGPHPDPRDRPLRRVCGRKALLARLDDMLSQEDNVRKIIDGLQVELDLAPAKFFHERVVPLMPTDMLRDEQGGETPEDQAAKIREAVAAAESVTVGGTLEVSGVLKVGPSASGASQQGSTPPR